MASLYLIPTTLGDNNFSRILPQYTQEIVRGVKHMIVENVRSARRYLKALDRDIDIDSMTFYTLNRHTAPEQITTYLKPLAEGHDMGVISEAGCPAIADPGADVVAIAQQKGYSVVPLVGPSSILLALMASGFNGQSFAFNGYLPIDAVQRQHAIRHYESRARSERQSQIFIETPYRNNTLREVLLSTLAPQTKLAIATDITLPTESIKAQTVQQWRKAQLADINHHPTIFIIF